jgi:hypothetical protein
MKKLTVLALLAAVVMAAPAFAVGRNIGVVSNATFAAGSPATTNNNDSCDIGVTPAATLLLPYFEVDTAAAAGTGATTLFTITNTSRFPQIAHVTLWTAWSTPVLDFNLYLTGYDVQPINLYDIIVRGVIAPANGAVYTTTAGTVGPNVIGATPLAAGSANNPNLTAATASTCSNIPGTLPGGQGGAVQIAVQSALTTGSTSALCSGAAVGPNNGTRAIGYATIDVAAECTNYLPTDPLYYTSTNGILFDNVLIGDYQQLAPSPAGSTGSGFDAAGNPMVHIRAIPEGGPAGSAPGTNLPFTFYNRYSNAATAGNPGLDRRQPLPSQWAGRWVGGTVSGGAATFNTDFKIWREGISGATACPGSVNSAIAVTNTIRFDEHENSLGFGTNQICSPFCTAGGIPGLPEASRVAVGTATNGGTSGSFPNVPSTGLTSGDVGGWMYMNLSSGGRNAAGTAAATGVLTASRAGFGGTLGTRTTTQNWVVVSMFGNVGTQRLAADFDAAWLGNGCSAAPASGAVIGPLATYNGTTTVLVCPVGATCATAPYGPSNPTP